MTKEQDALLRATTALQVAVYEVDDGTSKEIVSRVMRTHRDAIVVLINDLIRSIAKAQP